MRHFFRENRAGYKQGFQVIICTEEELSHRNIEVLTELDEACEQINSLSMTMGTSLAISLHYIAESIRRTGEYAGDISETVINYLVEEQGV